MFPLACVLPISDKLHAGVAAFIELCSGPLYILAKVQLADGVAAVAEAAATIAKGASTLFLLKTSHIPVAITLSWAQVRALRCSHTSGGPAHYNHSMQSMTAGLPCCIAFCKHHVRWIG